MSERKRTDNELLAELGWLTVQWARLEGYIDLISAYLHRSLDVAGGVAPPPAFNGRVKYVRRALKHHSLINLHADGQSLLDATLSISRKRNDLVHGIVMRWTEPGVASHTVLRRTEAGYIAVQDLSVSLDQLRQLCRSIWELSVSLFHFLERVKSISRFLKKDDEFWMTATLEATYD